jgi:hypothetical protein
MPKLAWGADVTPDDVDSAESSGQIYEGEIPPAGVYRFKIKTLKSGESRENKNPMATFLMLLDDPRKAVKAYQGCPLFGQVVITKQTGWKIKEFCAALGISSTDFLKKAVTDEEGNILKFGTQKIKDTDVFVKVNVKREARQDPNDGMRLVERNFMPLREAAEADDTDAGDEPETKPAAKKGKKAAEVTPEPAKPAKAGKTSASKPAKKGKKGKDDEPPF